MKKSHLEKLVYTSLALGIASGCGPAKPAAAPKTIAPINAERPASDENVSPAQRVETAIKLIQTKTYAEAKKLLEKALADDERNSKAHFYLAVAHEGLDDKDSAAVHYRKALELDPKLTEAAENLSALLLDNKDYEGALLAVNIGLKTDPKNFNLLRNRAIAEQGAGKLDDAAKSYSELLALKGEDEGFRYAYAEVLTGLGQKDKALLEWDKLLQSKNADMLAAMSKPLAKLEAYDKCVGALDKALELKKDPEFYVRRGLCRQKVTPFDAKAELADYNGALAIKADYTPAHYYLGMAHFKNKQFKEAQTELEKVVASGDPKFVDRAKKQLEAVAAAPAAKKGSKKSK